MTHQQIAVYEEFARNIPGFLPTAHDPSQAAVNVMKPLQVSVSCRLIVSVINLGSFLIVLFSPQNVSGQIRPDFNDGRFELTL